MKIIILSRDKELYSTKKLIEVGLERGHSIEAIDFLKFDFRIGKKTELIYQNLKLEKIDALIPRIGSYFLQNGIYTVKHFEKLNVFSTASSEGILLSNDKFSSIQMLQKEEINLPKTVYLNSINNLDSAIKFVGGAPLIIKILNGTQGLGVILAETKQSAISIIETLYRTQIKFVLQEYIKESNGTDIRVFVIGNKVVSAMKRIGKKGDFRSNIHRGGTGEKIKLTSEEEEIAIKTSKIFNLNVCGVDLLRSKKGPLFLEINSSPGIEGIENYTKIDVASGIIEFIEENAK